MQCRQCGGPLDPVRGCVACAGRRPRAIVGGGFLVDDGAPTRLEPALDPLTGRVLAGRFQLLHPIGVGSTGRVYKARHLGLDRFACVKVLTPWSRPTERDVRRFEREARAAARVDHPHVVQVYDVGSDGELRYIAMELVEGPRLDALLARESPLDGARACTLGAQIADAVGAAHACGVVHRDLRAGNVLVTTHRGAERVKVLDFGVARLLDGDSTRETPLENRPLRSPEERAGGIADARSDLWALGVVLHQLATGVLPHAAGGAASSAGDVPDAYETLVRELLVDEPALRPATALDVRDRLRRLAAEAPRTKVPRAPPALSSPVPPAAVAAPPALGEPATVRLAATEAIVADDDDAIRAAFGPQRRARWIALGLAALVVAALVALA